MSNAKTEAVPDVNDVGGLAGGTVTPITRPATTRSGRGKAAPPAGLDRMILGNDGKPKSVFANALILLQHDPAWKGVIAYDERDEKPVFIATPPFRDVPTKGPRDIRDADASRVVQWLEEHHGVTVSIAQAHAAIDAVAATVTFDRVRDYLDGLAWDGVQRLDSWLVTYLGAVASEYASAVGRRWMISAVARTYAPGCKADHVLVLEGPQGIGKSTALKTLAGEDNFGDDIADLGSKDSQQYLGGLLIVELGEMEAATKAESAMLKRFLGTTTDRYRPPYGRYQIKHGRRCVFAGSVNLEEYLKDSTGGRRFWPVACQSVDIDGLAAARDQLWAETVVAYRAGEPWHLDDPELVRLAGEHQAQRLEADPWEDTIAAFIGAASRTFVTTAEILAEALHIEVARMTKADRNRAGAVMRHLGWAYVQTPGRGWARP